MQINSVLKLHHCEIKKKKKHYGQISITFPQSICVRSKKKGRRKKLTFSQNLPDISYGTLPTTAPTDIKIDEAWLKIEFQGVCGSKNTLGIP